jgi:hypothetical protein
MSVEHRYTDTLSQVSRRRTDSGPQPVSPEYSHPATRAPLPARIERTQLQLRVVALERQLKASEDRRQQIIDQYELLLQDREPVPGTTEDSTWVGRLLKRI